MSQESPLEIIKGNSYLLLLHILNKSRQPDSPKVAKDETSKET